MVNKLVYLIETKDKIREAINAKGVPVSETDTFRSYADKIGQISAGGGSGGTGEAPAADNSLVIGILDKSIESADLPEGLTKIGDSCFLYCENLSHISFPNSLQIIDNYAFIGCTSLTSITLPANIRYCGFAAFADCYNITTINVPWGPGQVSNAPWGARNATINYNYTGA